MTASDISNGFVGHVFRNKTQSKVFPNVFYSGYECDLLEITKAGYTYEYEIKISVADFKADSKKSRVTDYEFKDGKINLFTVNKHKENPDGGRVNYFYYLVPKGLIKPEDVPAYAGLIYAKLGEFGWSEEGENKSIRRMYFEEVKPAKKLSSDKINEKSIFKLYEKLYYKYHHLKKQIYNGKAI